MLELIFSALCGVAATVAFARVSAGAPADSVLGHLRVVILGRPAPKPDGGGGGPKPGR